MNRVLKYFQPIKCEFSAQKQKIQLIQRLQCSSLIPERNEALELLNVLISIFSIPFIIHVRP